MSRAEVATVRVAPGDDRTRARGLLESEARAERARQSGRVFVERRAVERGEQFERGLGADEGLPGGRDIEARRIGGQFHRVPVAGCPRVGSRVPAREDGRDARGELLADRQEGDAARGAQPLVRVADHGVVVGGIHRQPPDGLGRVAQCARTVSRGRGANRSGIRHLAGRRLHERERDEPGVRSDRVGEFVERSDAQTDAAPRVRERQDHRGEVALDAEHLGAVRNGSGDESREHRRLGADRHTGRVDAHDPGEVTAGALHDGGVLDRCRTAVGGGIQIGDHGGACRVRRKPDRARREVGPAAGELGPGGAEIRRGERGHGSRVLASESIRLRQVFYLNHALCL